MNDQQHMVRQFHAAFGHPVGEVPHVLELERATLRAKWMREEIDEMLEAAETGDLVGFYDAILDLQYFAYGTAVEAGMDLEPGFLAVQSSNMAKLGPDGKPILNAEGKVQKPEGWEPPEEKHFQILMKQMEDARIFSLAKEMAAAFVADEEYRLPGMSPADVVRVTQGVSVILKATDPAAHERWAEEYDA